MGLILSCLSLQITINVFYQCMFRVLISVSLDTLLSKMKDS